MRVKVIIALLAAMILVGALAYLNALTQAEVGNDGKRTVVTFWYTSGKFPLEKLIQEYNASQDSVFVDGSYQGGYEALLQKLLLSVVTKSTPAIAQVEISLASQLVEYEAVMALNRFLNREQFLEPEDFIPQIFASCVYGDSIYAIPTNVSEPMLYINRDLLKAAGFSRDYVPQTWEELRAASRQVRALGDNYFGFDIRVEDWDVETFIWQWGGDIIGNDGRSYVFDSPQAVAAIAFLVDMIKEKTAVWSTGDVEKFLSGRAAFTNKSSASFGHFIRYTNFDLDVAPLPAGPAGRTMTTGGANVYFFKGHTEKEYRAALAFMKFLLGVRQQIFWSMETGYMVSLWSTVESDTMKQIFAADPRRQQPYLAVKNARPRPRFGPYNSVNVDLVMNINAALQLLYTPVQALQESKKIALKKLERYYF